MSGWYEQTIFLFVACMNQILLQFVMDAFLFLS